MSVQIGTLLIEMSANVARLQEDMSRASKTVDNASRQMAKSFEQVKTAFEVIIGSAALKAVVDAGMAAEQSANRLTAAYKLQGEQVGFTRQQLDDMAESLAAATQFKDNDIKRAEAELLKFGNIYGDVFTRAMALSADLAAFQGTAVAEGASALGKALTNPIDGTKALGAAIGKLSAEERDHIKTLQEHNKGLEVQAYVMDLVQKKIGGTAELMNSGYTKAIEDTAKAWDKFKESIAGIPIIKDTVVSALEAIADALRGVASVFQGGSFNEGVLGARTAMAKQITDLQFEIQQREQRVGLTFTDDQGRVIGEDLRVDELKEKLQALEAEYNKLYQTQAQAPKVGKVDLGMTQEQIAFLKSLQEENATAQGGGDAVFGKLFKADQLGVMDKARPIIIETATALNTQANAVNLAQKAWRDYLAMDQFHQDQKDATRLLIENTRRASVGGTRGERAKWDEVDRQDLERDRMARTLSEDAVPGFMKKTQELQLAWSKAFDENYRVTRSFASGFKTTMSEIYEDATDSAAQVHGLFVDAFHGMEDALVAFVKTGKLNFHDMADSIITDLIRIQIQRSVTAPLSGLLGASFNSLFGGGAPTGSTAPTFNDSMYIESPQRRAFGGPVSANQPYWVGDGGEPELFVPGSSGNVVPMSKMGGGVHIESISIGQGASPESVQAAFQQIRDLRASVGTIAVNAVASAKQRGAAGMR